MNNILSTTSQCQLAESLLDREQVYKLRYRCYRRKGSIAEADCEAFSDEFDALPNSFSFLVRSQAAEPLATVRINVVSASRGWSDSPVRHVYGGHSAFEEIARESFVEANRLCFAEQARRDTFVGLVGHMAALADVFDAQWMVACPRVEHAGVYQRMFGFQPLAEPRQYFGVSFSTQLLGIRRQDLEAYVRSARPLHEAWLRARRYLEAKLVVDYSAPRSPDAGSTWPPAAARAASLVATTLPLLTSSH